MTAVERPIFLVGAERSGTTLLRLMLDSHPKIAFNLESEYLVTQISENGEFPEIARYREWLESDRVFRHSRFRIDARLDFPALLNDFLQQKRSRDGKDLVGATVHHQFARLRRIWPRARYLYLYRDGRDVASSVMRMGWAGNVYVAGDRWLDAEREWDRLRTTLAPEDWIEVRYENLIAETGAELARICRFLSVEFSDKMFDYVRTSSYSAPDAGRNYQWKTGMSKRALQRLEAKLGDRLWRRGYEPSGHPRISVSPFTSYYLKLQSRFKVYFVRLDRFGLALSLRETLSRRLGLKRMHRETIRRIDQIVDATLK